MHFFSSWFRYCRLILFHDFFTFKNGSKHIKFKTLVDICAGSHLDNLRDWPKLPEPGSSWNSPFSPVQGFPSWSLTGLTFTPKGHSFVSLLYSTILTVYTAAQNMWTECFKLSRGEPGESNCQLKKMRSNMMHCAFWRSAGRDFLGYRVNLPSSFRDWLDHAHLWSIEIAF